MNKNIVIALSIFSVISLNTFQLSATQEAWITGEKSEDISFVDNYGLIPVPHSVTAGEGYFQITPLTKFMANSDAAAEVADLFTHFLIPPTRTVYKVSRSDAAVSGAVNFMINESVSDKEGYRLTVSSDQILIEASTSAGLFYGSQTVRQLLPTEIEKRTPINNVAWKVPAVTIEDAPVFGYRGMHLDVARHFFDKNFVKKYIDYIAAHKMNVFHWHLTEDQGWRIEIKKYPKLTSMGSKRSGTVVGHAGSRPIVNDNVPYGGYYTQEEIKEIIAYAARRHVEIIPEIDIPGHSTALLNAYPEYSCHGRKVDVGFRFGIVDDVLCPTEATFSMLKDIFTEVAELFPSKYIHIGGDEVRKGQWDESEFVQKMAKREGLHDMHEVQSYFIRRVEKDINALGKSIIGWDEILEGGIAPNATIMSWRGEEGGIAAAKQRHDVIMSPNSHFYFDHYTTASEHEKTRIGGLRPLKSVYHYSPYIDGLSPEEQKHILGVQANVWSEYILDGADVEYMIFPRMSALSEIVWNPKGRNWDSFLNRLPRYFSRLDAMGANASRGVYVVEGETTNNDDGTVSITLTSNGKGHEIRYSLDGSNPINSDMVYTKPLTLSGDFFMRATAYDLVSHKAYGDFRSEYTSHLARGKTIVNNKVNGAGKTLDAMATDGKIGANRHNIPGGNWITIQLNDGLDLTVDLESAINVSEVSFGFNPSKARYYHRPEDMTVQLSMDGKTWSTAAIVNKADFARFTNVAKAEFKTTKARYVRVISNIMESEGVENSRIYFDELVVR